jgi:hypothetical protein
MNHGVGDELLLALEVVNDLLKARKHEQTLGNDSIAQRLQIFTEKYMLETYTHRFFQCVNCFAFHSVYSFFMLFVWVYSHFPRRHLSP